MPDGERVLRVSELRARVSGSRVSFVWRQHGGEPLQHAPAWGVDYEGVELSALGRDVLWDVFWSLQLPVWRAGADRVEVSVSEPVSLRQLAWWRAYHDAERVRVVSALTDRDAPPSPVAVGSGPVREPQVAVSFGGGKDSALALGALLQGRLPSQLLLAHVVQHFSTRADRRWRFDRRSRRRVVAPARRLTGVGAQIVSTDFLARLTPRGKRLARPHITLYTAGLLPALMHHGVQAVTVGRTAIGYRVVTRDGEPVRWANPSGRPERMRALGRYYRAVHGVTLLPQSTHYAVGEFVSFGALAALHPRAFGRVVMCMRTTSRRRWCGDCEKCRRATLFGLALDVAVPDADHDAVLTSPSTAALVRVAREATEPAWHGNAGYRPEVGDVSQFAAFCHALHEAGSGRHRLGRQARANLAVLRGAWGNRPWPAVAAIDADAVAACDPLGREVAEHAGSVFPTVPGGQLGALLVGDDVAEFAHGEAMPLPALDAWFASWAPGRDQPGSV